ncbi:MAG: ATP-binding protein [Actinomycetota bacterium]|nr:ATP-binding protein [Actinomycetota bacterium]
MLRSFRLANHRSFRDQQELLLMPSYDNDREVVPIAAVFGANASGKSNLLDGLRLMSDLVQGWDTREPGSGIPRSPFRLDPKSLLEPSSFAVELVLDGVRYTYGFTVDYERIITEWLHAYPRNRRRVLFERDGTSIDFGSTMTQQTRAEVIKDLVNEDTLFLAVASRLKLDQYRPVADWFRRFLLFVRASHREGDDARLARFIEQSEPDRAMLLDLVRMADVGISDITVEYVEDPQVTTQVEMLEKVTEALRARIACAGEDAAQDIAKQLRWAQTQVDFLRERSRQAKLLLTHGGVGFELRDESEGTKLWLNLLPQVITSLGSGRTLVIDEIGTSLHPLLLRKLVGLFRDPMVNVGGAQLLFTTHDAFLLAPMAGETGLDRDQVWFVEKRADGASELYPLTDFKPRKNEHNLARRYLGGSYGAIPVLDGFDSLAMSAPAE